MDSVREWNLCAELQHWPTLFLMSFWWRLRFIYTVHVSCALATISIPTLWQQWTRGPTALSFVRFDSSLTLACGVPHYVCKERSLNQACKQQAQGTEMKIVISHHCRIHRKKRWGKKNICSVSTNECPAWGLRMNVYTLLRWKCSENKCPECKLNQVRYIFLTPLCLGGHGCNECKAALQNDKNKQMFDNWKCFKRFPITRTVQNKPPSVTHISLV